MPVQRIGYGSRRILTEFSKTNVKTEGKDTLLKNSGDKKYRPKAREWQTETLAYRTEENVTTVGELAAVIPATLKLLREWDKSSYTQASRNRLNRLKSATRRHQHNKNNNNDDTSRKYVSEEIE